MVFWGKNAFHADGECLKKAMIPALCEQRGLSFTLLGWEIGVMTLNGSSRIGSVCEMFFRGYAAGMILERLFLPGDMD